MKLLNRRSNSLALINANCLDYMPTMLENSVDSIITDPPYELKFMSNKWDSTGISFRKETWEKCFRVLKPGGFLLAFGCPKNVHRMVCAIEDAGFIIKDEIFYIYGTGMPHGQNIGKAIKSKFTTDTSNNYNDFHTQLKPATEVIVVAQKPISERTYAENVIKWGTGAFNIGACRIPLNKLGDNLEGRFPSNIILDEITATLADKIYGNHKSGTNCYRTKEGSFFDHGGLGKTGDKQITYGDEGGISRFFYCSKSSKSEKNMGCENLPKGNNHVTVKPVSLMQYLVRLVTPPHCLVLDPFMGSGTTGIACVTQGFKFIGIEKDKDYCNIAKCRIDAWNRGDLK